MKLQHFFSIKNNSHQNKTNLCLHRHLLADARASQRVRWHTYPLSVASPVALQCGVWWSLT